MIAIASPPLLTDRVDLIRIEAARHIADPQRTTLGQFLTPVRIARLMASMFEFRTPVVRILDAGAGVGSLLAASTESACARAHRPRQIEVTAYEMDAALTSYLRQTIDRCRSTTEGLGIGFKASVHEADFIEVACRAVSRGLFPDAKEEGAFTCAILNPPYRKISSDSATRRKLRAAGIETTNLYTAFVSLAVRLLAEDGELVAIVPRSFCNGPYFKSFRKSFLSDMAIHRVHLFDSRKEAFRDDEVLQENLILHATRTRKKPKTVSITTSSGPDDEASTIQPVAYERVVRPDDAESFIHLVTDELGERVVSVMRRFKNTLAGLGLSVSTGPVVDFRVRDYLRKEHGDSTAPLVYPVHSRGVRVQWPIRSRKPNALMVCPETLPLLLPVRPYVLVRRFSSKEERKRLVASVLEPACIPSGLVGLENHLNYIHGKNLTIALARGLAAFLNWTLVDSYFRLFNGHTQVNSTDLRNLAFPSKGQLERLGGKLARRSLNQDRLDGMVSVELLGRSMSPARDPVRARKHVQEALKLLKELGLPREQQNERSALTLLALLDLTPDKFWEGASAPLCGITPMMDWFAKHYGKRYKPNTRETVRRQTVHQFMQAGLIVINPDDPSRPTNSPKAVYQVSPAALDLLRSRGGTQWRRRLTAYLASVKPLSQRYARERKLKRISVKVDSGETVTLSPGGQNALLKQIVEDFGSRFTPGGKLLYLGDTALKFAYFNDRGLSDLGVQIDLHGKMPDVIILHEVKAWLVLIEAVTSHGPVNPKRREELTQLFQKSKAGLVFVTAFENRRAMVKYLSDISWETEVWVADAPDHLIHFNGERFLGPYEA